MGSTERPFQAFGSESPNRYAGHRCRYYLSAGRVSH
jgi:hypothetical protein